MRSGGADTFSNLPLALAAGPFGYPVAKGVPFAATAHLSPLSGKPRAYGTIIDCAVPDSDCAGADR